MCRKYGAVREKMLPFHTVTKMYTGAENVFWAHAAQHRVASYFNLRKDLANWKVAGTRSRSSAIRPTAVSFCATAGAVPSRSLIKP